MDVENHPHAEEPGNECGQHQEVRRTVDMNDLVSPPPDERGNLGGRKEL